MDISIIMACYNSSSFIDEAISSLFDQSIEILELILIDDCSSDDTLEIIKHRQMADNRIKVISLPSNSGPAAARNAGFLIAEGDWIGILDSDDIALPAKFEKQMKLADHNNELVMIGSNSISIDSKGKFIKEHNYPANHKYLVKRLASMRAFPPHSSIIYKKSAIKKLGGFNQRYSWAEDYDLWLRLSNEGKLGSIKEPLVKIRKHKSNVSNSGGGRMHTKYVYIAAICHYLRENGIPDPSIYMEDKAWKSFISWVEMRMEDEGIFSKYKSRSDAREKYFLSSNFLLGALGFAKNIWKSGYTYQLIIEKLLGSTFPKKLAGEWINHEK